MPATDPSISTPAPVRPSLGVGRQLWLPIVGGPLRGQRWCPASGGKLMRVLLGTYEQEQSSLFLKHIGPGDVVIDIGAACGYYTLLASKLVGKAGRVVSFEPDPKNSSYLRRHVAANELQQATILQLALSDNSGKARFGGGSGTGTGRLCDEGAYDVTVRRLDDIAAQLQLAPTHLKIDVEGAELSVLRGGEQTIRRYLPKIFLSTHPGIVKSVHADCCDLLTRWGYDLQPILGGELARSTEVLAISRAAQRLAA
jgi:FkbM family methyltransferase